MNDCNYILTSDGKLRTVSNEELYHYGVKGMKWKKRNAVEDIAKGAIQKKRSRDLANRTVLKSEFGVEKVGYAIEKGAQKKKKKSIAQRANAIRRKYGLYRIKPKGKKLKGSKSITVSHNTVIK